MTPAINSAKKAKIPFTLHSYAHDSTSPSYGKEAAEKLGIAEESVFKTLVVQLDGHALAVGIIPVSMTLNMKQIAKSAKAKKAAMADKSEVERATGYVLGGVSPLGQKKRLPTIIHSSAISFSTIFVSAGRRGLELELKPADLADLTGAIFAEIGDAR
ncbi:MAG: Cys-tRNA(Pro) deacylase [Pseudomonadota bacterium]